MHYQILPESHATIESISNNALQLHELGLYDQLETIKLSGTQACTEEATNIFAKQHKLAKVIVESNSLPQY